MATLRREAFKPGEVASKYKLLASVLISVTLRCEPCIRGYVEWAVSKGATREELVEFLNIAVAMQGCPGEEWALKALDAHRELTRLSADGEVVNGQSQSQCCEHSHGAAKQGAE
jgi:AhpD family alkylhydroperoxidase